MRCILFGHRPVRHPVVNGENQASGITICADCGKTIAVTAPYQGQPRGFEAARRDHFAEAK